MAAIGKYGTSVFGYNGIAEAVSAVGPGTVYDMKTQYAAWAGRFHAATNDDVIGVYLNWSAVSSPPDVRVRIETVDATSGKPNGIYDAEAEATLTPAAGWNFFDFSVTPPTTGLVADADYAITAVSTGATGTTSNMNSYVSVNSLPAGVLTAADGNTVPPTWAETFGRTPIAVLVFEGSYMHPKGMCPFAAYGTYQQYCSGTQAVGTKLTAITTMQVSGYCVPCLYKNGNPAGDLRFRIIDNASSELVGSVVTLNRNLITMAGRKIRINLPASVNLTAAGSPYYLVADSAGSTGSTAFGFQPASTGAGMSSVIPSGLNFTYTTNYGAGPPITWVTTNMNLCYAPILPIIDDILPPASTGGLLVHPGMSGGCRG
jgi:hypothetical protein